jgi:hypothetical protein
VLWAVAHQKRNVASTTKISHDLKLKNVSKKFETSPGPVFVHHDVFHCFHHQIYIHLSLMAILYTTVTTLIVSTYQYSIATLQLDLFKTKMKNRLVNIVSVGLVLLLCLVQPRHASSFSLKPPPSLQSRTKSHGHYERPSAVSPHHRGKMSSTSSSSSQAVLPRTASTHDAPSEQSPMITRSTSTTSGTVGVMMTTVLVVMMTTFGVFLGGPLAPAFADEYGVEKEAPTLLTGETVEVRRYVGEFLGSTVNLASDAHFRFISSFFGLYFLFADLYQAWYPGSLLADGNENRTK